MQVRRTLATTVALTTALLAAGCADDELASDTGSSEEKGSVKISGQNFPEATLVASMYEQLLEAEGYDVTVALVDTRDVYMADGQFPDSVQIVPEYVASLVNFLNTSANGPEAEPLATNDATESIEAASSLLEDNGITLLEPSEASDTNAYFVTQDYADTNDVSTLSDLKGKSVVLAAHPDCPDRPDCEGGLTDVYGIDVTKVLPLGFASAQTYQSVLDGESQLGQTSTTDGSLESQDLVLLDDDQGIQSAENLVPAVSSEWLADHPDVEDTLNSLMAALDTEKLTELNGRVSVDREKVEDVAQDFLESEGLI